MAKPTNAAPQLQPMTVIIGLRPDGYPHETCRHVCTPYVHGRTIPSHVSCISMAAATRFNVHSDLPQSKLIELQKGEEEEITVCHMQLPRNKKQIKNLHQMPNHNNY